MKNSLFTQSLLIARREIKGHPEFENYLHWSFVVKNNQIVEWATNNKGLPPVYLGYSKRIDSAPAKIHSEFAAYKRAKGIIKGSFEIINIRLNRDGEMRNSAPCICCMGFLFETTKCSKVWYSTSEGTFDKIKG